ncbi:MAG: nitroreductase family protein [Alphaproteobacteria bacterium]|nr:nitroreductase family protein [Alphaproteobacteria bacterium]
MELNDVMRTTFSARDYTGDPVPDEVIYDILDTARFAPSGGNRQGNRVIIVRDQETRDRISKIAEQPAKIYAAQRDAGESPWNTIVPSDVTAQRIEETPPLDILVEPYRNASVVLVFAVDLRVVASMDKELDRIGVISGASIYPFVWNTLLAARQAGFGGTITTVPVANEPEVKKLLNIPLEYAVSALVPLGKPVKQLTRLRRKPVEKIATRGTFDGEPFTV